MIIYYLVLEFGQIIYKYLSHIRCLTST